MEEINNFQQESDETLYQAWERFKELLMKCPQHYLTEMQEVILFYNGLDVPTRQILDSRGVVPTKTAANVKKAIQEMTEYSQNGTIGHLEEEKVNEKVYAAQVGCEQCKGPHYTKDCPLKKEVKTLEEAYCTQFGGPFQGGGYRATTLGFCQRNNANPSYQEQRQSTEDTLSKMGESAKRHEENSNLIKEIRASMDATIRNQGASIKTLEIQIGQIRKILQERGFRSLPSSTETNPRDQVKSISTTIEADSHPICRVSLSVMPFSTYLNLGLGKLAHTKLIVELADRTVKYPKGIAKNVLVEIGKFTFPVDFIVLYMPEDVKVSLILKRPFLMELDLEAMLMGETLVINRSLDHLNGDYIGLNDLNEPFKLRRNQCNNLKPTIEEGEVIEEFRTRDDKFDIKIDDYPNKMVYKGDNVVGALMNVPIFVGNFSVVTDFAVLEDMNAYRDDGMGDVSVGKPFLREVKIKARWFEGTITLYKGDESVTYQMVRSHPRFKRHTNEQCNKILPLLKVSEEDEINGISHPYQKLKGF
ncbi:putative reverse transcriptase domain-containing protein [Tanacetum coccineum]